MKPLKIRGPETGKSLLGTWIIEQSSPCKHVAQRIWTDATYEIVEDIQTYFFPLNRIVNQRIANEILINEAP